MKHCKIKATSLVFGLLVMAVGMLLFAFNIGFLPPEYKPIVFSWPALIMALGFVCLFSWYKRFPGIILLLIGGAFLLPKLHIDRLNFAVQNGWALGLIIGGLLLLYKAIWGRCPQERHERFRMRMERHRARHHAHSWEFHSATEPGYIERNYVFSGNKEKINIQDFKGGDINCVFGGLELDLTDAKMAEGVHRLEINSVFGGVNLYVPVEWKIEIRQDQVFGRFLDNRPNPSFEVNDNSKLILEVTSVFGGGEINCRQRQSTAFTS
ncbi:MAG: cell wall-active antibiotics response protein [Bacteroidales bacterium]|jgi:predicted membrane protein|nr:cell wall-active antibiotics response protein [Bacteroidales bacterium]